MSTDTRVLGVVSREQPTIHQDNTQRPPRLGPFGEVYGLPASRTRHVLADSGQAAAAIRTSIVCLPPVILGATDQLLLALHGQASQSAAGIYKVRMGWWEV